MNTELETGELNKKNLIIILPLNARHNGADVHKVKCRSRKSEMPRNSDSSNTKEVILTD